MLRKQRSGCPLVCIFFLFSRRAANVSEIPDLELNSIQWQKLLSLPFLIDRDTNYHVKEFDPGSGFLMRGGSGKGRSGGIRESEEYLWRIFQSIPLILKAAQFILTCNSLFKIIPKDPTHSMCPALSFLPSAANLSN